MKTLLCTLVLSSLISTVPAYASSAIDLGNAQAERTVKPVGYGIEIEDWSGIKMNRLNAIFSLSQCEAEEVKSDSISRVKLAANHYVVIFAGAGSNDCGIEMDPPKFLYKLNIGYVQNLPTRLMINGQSVSRIE